MCIALFFLRLSNSSAQSFSKDSINLLLSTRGDGIERIQLLNKIAESLSDKNTSLAAEYASLALIESEKSNYSKEKRTGLGLLICAEYAAANNWQIKVDSEIEKGTIFSLILSKT